MLSGFHLFLKMLKVLVCSVGNSIKLVSASPSTHGRNRDLNSLFNTTVSSCLSDLGFDFKCFDSKGPPCFCNPGISAHKCTQRHFARRSHSPGRHLLGAIRLSPQALYLIKTV